MSRFISLAGSSILMIVIFLPLLIFTDNALQISNKPVKWILGSVLLVRLLYSALYTSLQLKSFVVNTILPYLTPAFFVLIGFVAVLYGSHKGVQASARIAPVTLGLYVLVIISISLMLLPQFEFIRLYSPIAAARAEGFPHINYSAFNDIIRNDELFFFAVLAGIVRKSKRERQSSRTGSSTKETPQAYKAVLYYIPPMMVVLLWLNLLYNAILGRFLTSVPYPLYTISVMSAFNVIERMDGIVATAVMVSGFLKITLAFICVRIVLSELIHSDMTSRKKSAKITTSALVAGVAVATYLLIGRETWFRHDVVTFSLMCATIMISSLLPVAAVIFRKEKDNEQT
jgi:hypothetical protein